MRLKNKWTAEKTMTALIITFCVVTMLVYDLCVILFFRDVNATISNTVHQMTKRAPVIAFIAGFIMGHLFWPITGFRERENVSENNKVEDRGYNSNAVEQVHTRSK